MLGPHRSAWVSVGVLGALCAGLAIVQYRWIGEITGAERIRLQGELESRLAQTARAFNEAAAAVCFDLMPPAEVIERLGAEAAYSAQYVRWRERHGRALARAGYATPFEGRLRLFVLNPATARYEPSDWPAEWNGMEEHLMARLERRPAPSSRSWPNAMLFEFPRFGATGGEREWLVVELDAGYLRGRLLPSLIERNLGPNYAWELLERPDPAQGKGDASVGLLAISFGQGGRPSNGARWQLRVRNREGSLETLVARVRRRNLAISAGILLLIVGSVFTLLRFSRQSQQLAQAQINFVAGVSHELRTPLTVIRTAAYNLRGRVAARPEQVERYGKLIEAESKKLTT